LAEAVVAAGAVTVEDEAVVVAVVCHVRVADSPEVVSPDHQRDFRLRPALR
jgi:hypothetical protein